MNYDFSLDKKGVFSVLAGWVVMAALLFVAGLIVGTYWTAGTPSVAAASGKGTSATKTDSAELPAEPVRPAETLQTDLLTARPTNGSAGVTAGDSSTAQGARGSQSAPQPPAAAAGPMAGSADQPAGDKATNPAAAKDADEKNQNAGAAAGNQNVVEPQLYTVEVGAFLDPNDANRLFRKLEREGYAPNFFSDRDGENREWYSIRIGAYSDRQQAENAAANFTKQEKIKAKVRLLGSL